MYWILADGLNRILKGTAKQFPNYIPCDREQQIDQLNNSANANFDDPNTHNIKSVRNSNIIVGNKRKIQNQAVQPSQKQEDAISVSSKAKSKFKEEYRQNYINKMGGEVQYKK